MKKQNQTHKPWIITAKAGGEIEILLYEMIGEDFWTGEGTTAKQFAEDLKAAGKVSKIHLRVNSPGGSVFDGLAIYNTLLSHGAKVTAQVDGLAASIASVIIMAASEISMGDNAMMMIHNPATVIAGDSNDMRKMAETMDKVKTSMITAYRRHSKKSIDQIGALMDAETWMTAQETVDNGFAEKVITPEGDDAAVAANFAPMLAIFRKVPQQIAARFAAKDTPAEECACECLPCSKENNCTDCANEGCQDENCEDCAMQAKAKAAKAKAAARSSKLATDPSRLRGSEDACGCECLPCSKENNCTDCANADCIDDDCAGCPMQAKAKATAAAKELSDLRTELATANKTIEALKGDLTTALAGETDASSHAALNLKFLQRISSELETGATLYASAIKNLPAERNAAEQRIAQLEADLDHAHALLVAEREGRREDAGATAVFVERLNKELLQAGQLHDRSAEEFSAVVAAAASNESKLSAELESALTALAAEKKARLNEATAHVNWTERMTAELSKAGKLYAGAIAELPRRIAAAEARAAQLCSELENVHIALAAEKKARGEEASAHAQWLGRVTADLKQAGSLYAGAIEVLPRRVRAAEHLVFELDAQLASARTALVPAGLIQILEEQRNTRNEELTALRQFTADLNGEFEKAASLSASASDELPRRAHLAEARATQLSSELDSLQSALAAGKKTRAEEATGWSEATRLLTAELQEAGSLYTGVMEELPRRGHSAEMRATQISAALAATETALATEKKTQAEEAAARGEVIARVTANLKQASTLHATAVEELPRRARTAELRQGEMKAAIEGVRLVIESEKRWRETHASASRKNEIDRMTAELQQAAALYAGAQEEIARRARLASL